MKSLIVGLILLVPCVAQAQFAGQIPVDAQAGAAASAFTGGEVEWARAQELVTRFRERQAEADTIVAENQAVRSFVCRNLGCAQPRTFVRPAPVVTTYEEVPVCESRAQFDFQAMRERERMNFERLRQIQEFDFAAWQDRASFESQFIPVGRSRTRVDIRVRERGGMFERFGGRARAGVGVNIGVGAGFGGGCRSGGCF